MAIFSVIVTTGGMSFKTGMEYAAANFAILESEITAARGSAASMAARLAVAHNQDGTHLAASTVVVDFKTTGYATVTKSDSDTFTITDPATDLSAILYPGRVIRFNNDGTAVYATIKASSFATATTTVDIFTTNVPATITQLDIGITHLGDAGSFVPIEPISTKPTYAAKYANRILMAIDTGVAWWGNPISGSFQIIGGNMTYKDYTNSADGGGSAVTVSQGTPVTTKLEFSTPTVLCGYLTKLSVVATGRAADTSDNFTVQVYENSDANDEDLVCQFSNLDATVEPWGVDLRNARYAIRNNDGTAADNDCLWVKITNLKTGDDTDFDIEAIVEHIMEG